MTAAQPLARSVLRCTVDGVSLEMAALSRAGSRAPIVFLHGFGSTKEDYADSARWPEFAGHAVLAYDAPGFGETRCADPAAVDLPFLVRAAQAALSQAGVTRCHLVGHSMGGLTALMLADQEPDRFLSFTNIEGNIAPEDCFLSRQIHQFADQDPDRFLDRFIERMRADPAPASALYAAGLRHKVRAPAVRGVFASMVDISDAPGLMGRFVGLPCAKMFMYGDDNASLSYLGHLAASGVVLAEIPRSGHFPMYSNPPAMWRALSAFLARLSPESGDDARPRPV